MSTNYYEYRLHQIEILLNAYNKESQYKDEILKLKEERDQILNELKYQE